MVLDFLESLENSKQLCYKHIELILLLKRPHSTNKATLSGFGQKQPRKFKEQKLKIYLTKIMLFSFLKILREVLQLMYRHKVMIHNLIESINTNM